MDRSRSYNQFYSSPGKSYVVEPKKGEINYKMARKDLSKFYDNVFEEKVTKYKFKDDSPKRIVFS
jgi:hypothetical protein